MPLVCHRTRRAFISFRCHRYIAETPEQQGVRKEGSRYQSKISIPGKQWNLGTYATEREACVVWDAAQVWRTVVNKTGTQSALCGWLFSRQIAA